jgi:hypothetical protein
VDRKKAGLEHVECMVHGWAVFARHPTDGLARQRDESPRVQQQPRLTLQRAMTCHRKWCGEFDQWPDGWALMHCYCGLCTEVPEKVAQVLLPKWYLRMAPTHVPSYSSAAEPCANAVLEVVEMFETSEHDS